MSNSLKSVVSILLVTCLISVCLAKVNIIDIPRKTVFNVAVIRNQKPVVVYFTTRTCSSLCNTILGELEDFARENDNDMYLARVYVDDHPELKEEYGIEKIPTTQTYFKGDIQDEILGARKASTMTAVKKVLEQGLAAKKRY